MLTYFAAWSRVRRRVSRRLTMSVDLQLHLYGYAVVEWIGRLP